MRAWSWSFAGRGWVTIFQFSGKKERDGLGPLRSDRLASALGHRGVLQGNQDRLRVRGSSLRIQPCATPCSLSPVSAGTSRTTASPAGPSWAAAFTSCSLARKDGSLRSTREAINHEKYTYLRLRPEATDHRLVTAAKRPRMTGMRSAP